MNWEAMRIGTANAEIIPMAAYGEPAAEGSITPVIMAPAPRTEAPRMARGTARRSPRHLRNVMMALVRARGMVTIHARTMEVMRGPKAGPQARMGVRFVS